MIAMILAAGRGERMRPLTDDTPKPLLRAGHKCLIDYHIDALVQAGVSRVVINLAWRGDQIKSHVGDGSDYGVEAVFSDEGHEALETGGGVQKALPLLGKDPFWLVNGDIYVEYLFNAADLAPRTLGHLILVPNPRHNREGDFVLDDSYVRPEGKPRYTFSGVSLLRPELFLSCKPGKFPLAPLLIDASEKDAITGEVFNGFWADVGTPERLAQLDTRLSSRRLGATR